LAGKYSLAAVMPAPPGPLASRPANLHANSFSSPRTDGICEFFRKSIRKESYQIAFGKNIYATLGELQADLDAGNR
jgi:hypothetical protein